MKRMVIHGLMVLGCFVVGFTTLQCAMAPSSSGTSAKGQVRVLITDKPFPFEWVESATVTINRVEVHLVGGNQTDDTVEAVTLDDVCMVDDDCDDNLVCNGEEMCMGDVCVAGTNHCADGELCDEVSDSCATPTSNNSSWIVIYEGGDSPKTFNLLELQNGRTDLLADTTVPAGSYNQMRLIVSEGSVQVSHDNFSQTFDLKVPSGAQTGIKIHLPFEVLAEGETSLLLDVDVSKAFVPIPGGRIDDPSTIQSFLFKPSLAMRLVNLFNTGDVAGSVVDTIDVPIDNVAVSVSDENGNHVTTTSTDPDGTYRVSGLDPGTYELTFSKSFFDTQTVMDITITSDQTTIVDVVLITTPTSSD